MSVEIERKFLVKNNSYKAASYKCISITQGFLNSNKKRVVRIRIADDKGFITIKGKTSDNGLTRYEWEKEIDLKEANSLLNLCEKGIIIKNRYLVKFKDWIYEVDEFSLQGYQVKNLIFAVSPYLNLGNDGLLGMNFLRLFDFHIDQAHNLLRLKNKF